MKRLQITFGVLLVAICVLAEVSDVSLSAPGYAQIILPFKSEKLFQYEWLRSENVLLLQLPNVSPNELDALNNYDERFIRRMQIKDLGPAGTEVRLVLINRDVRALVTSFSDPFRISIDLFDKDYRPKSDQVTGLPLIENDSAENAVASAPIASDPHKRFTPTQVNADSEVKGPPIEEPSIGRRRLLQSLPTEINSVSELKASISKIPPGVGKGWLDYPPYIYRAQLAPYEGREAPEIETSPFQAKALKASSGMAEYASRLYDLGHEGRALIAYQQVLLKEPNVFERDPVHLWKFAECHLGQGNFQLADGYYSSLIDKHSTHPLAPFAQIRKIDVIAIKSLQQGDVSALLGLKDRLNGLQTKGQPEQTVQSLIRKTWWEDPGIPQTKGAVLPFASEETQRELTSLIPKVESQRTAFLASSLIGHRITKMETPWEPSYAEWLNQYFANFKGPATEPIRENISSATKIRLAAEIKAVFANRKPIDVVMMFEALPEPMKSIRKQPDVAWAIAESYRLIGQLEKSVPAYQQAANLPIGMDRFKAQFWLMNSAGTVSLDYAAKRGNQDKIRTLGVISAAADTSLNETWSKLKSDERAQIQTAMAEAIEGNTASQLKSTTPPKILLEKYSSALTVNPPKLSTSTGNNPTEPSGSFSPTAGTVKLLDDLGKKFASLGMQPERRRTLELMRFIKPGIVERDKAAQKIWTDQLTSLAEDHRKANEFLEAGELYGMIGEGGASLLLYRAGKKQDAIKALERAKTDPNNLFYSKLATERLDQLQAH
ncbi:MAG: hypothetical protein NTV34_18455 [Proteobacteria bacterium]|nr:hypothetical protein [Pseudomonadota bacterium]